LADQDLDLVGRMQKEGRSSEEISQALDRSGQSANRSRSWRKIDRARLLLTYAVGSSLVALGLIVIDRFYQ